MAGPHPAPLNPKAGVWCPTLCGGVHTAARRISLLNSMFGGEGMSVR